MLDKIKSRKIAIDIDDVLSSTIPNLLKYLKEYYDIDYKYEEFLNYKFHEVEYFTSRNVTRDIAHNIWDSFSNSHHWKNMATIEWSEKVLQKLKDLWFEIYLKQQDGNH